MEYILLIIGAILCGLVGFYTAIEYIKALERSNDKLKATLVKKDFKINQDEIYIKELEKQVQFYTKYINDTLNIENTQK